LGKERLKSWRRKSTSVAAIAQTLFKVHGFDPDRAIAVAYWVKKGCVVRTSEYCFFANMRRAEILSDLTLDDAKVMLRDYQVFMGRRHYEIDQIP